MKPIQWMKTAALVFLSALFAFLSFAEPAPGLLPTAAAKSRPLPMDMITEWNERSTLFEAAVGAAKNNGRNKVFQLGQFLYQHTDPVGLVLDGFLDASDQEKQDELMKNLIRDNFVTYYVNRNSGFSDEVDAFAEDAANDLKDAGDALDFMLLEFPVNGEMIPITAFLSEEPVFSGTAGTVFRLVLGSAEIYCRSLHDVKAVLLMTEMHDCAITYLDHLQESAAPDSSLYRACEAVRREINERWPFGQGVPADIQAKADAEIVRLMSDSAADTLLSFQYENDAILISSADFVPTGAVRLFAGSLIAMKAAHSSATC